jgi:peptidyl-tRNA hydrolase
MTLPVLYILARNDLASMNPGKLAAQASHASNAFVFAYHEYMRNSAVDQANVSTVGLNKAFNQWQNSTLQGFGTVLVLEGSMTDISDVVKTMANMNYMAEVIHDPTYPIVDGNIVHHIPLDTCAYVFVPDKLTDHTASYFLGKFGLHK